jgi:septum formation topological specificity factor MinE
MTLPKLNNDIIKVIAKYLINPEYKLLDWIDINKVIDLRLSLL